MLHGSNWTGILQRKKSDNVEGSLVAGIPREREGVAVIIRERGL